jgi:colanic acid biosynthesis glycosyl transferase WcaI
MKILIHGINYTPELTGVGKYTGEMAEWLASRGHDVNVVTAPPYYPTWKVLPPYSGHRYTKENLHGVTVWRCPLWVPKSPDTMKRIIHLSTYALSSLPIMLLVSIFKRPDVIISIEPPLFCAPASLLCARLVGAKTWLHVQDFELSVFLGLGLVRSSAWLTRFLEIVFEGHLMRWFDHVSTISGYMLQRLLHLNIPSKRTCLLRNWADTDRIHPDTSPVRLRTALGITPDTSVILYSGNIGKKQGLETVLLSAKIICDQLPNVLFLIVGDGVHKGTLLELARKMSLKNIRIMPLLPREEFPEMLTLADIHLVIQKRGAADVVMPSKLTNILAAGGHAIITAESYTELGMFVNNNPGIATLVTPEDPSALADAIINLLNDDSFRATARKKSRKFAEEYLAKEPILTALEKELKSLIADKC